MNFRKVVAKRLALLPVACLVLMGAACGSPGVAQEAAPLPAGFAALDAMYEKATADGQTNVVIYGTTVDEKKPLIELFESRYPKITVETVRLVGANLSSKLQQEVAGSQVSADLVLAGSSSHYRHAAAGWYADPELAGIDDLDASAVVEADHAYAPSGTVFGIAYNKSKVSEAEAPKGWADLTKPEWKGRLGIIDPHALNGTTVNMAYLLNAGVVDEPWLGELSGQDARVAAEGSQLGQSLVSGTADAVFGYPLGYAVKDNAKGANIGYVFPTEGGSILAPEYMAMMKDAPNGEAGRLFFNWLFTPEAQKGFAAIGEYPLMPGSEVPEGLPALNDLKDRVEIPSGKELGAKLEETVALTKQHF